MADDKGDEPTTNPEIAEEKPAAESVEEPKAENKKIEVEGNKAKDEQSEEKKAKAEGSDESSDEEMLGLFDKDVLMEGKRERKKVPRLSSETITTPHAKRNSDLDFTEGKGTRLGDITWTEYEITRSASDELKPLHRLLYGRDGKSREVKKNLRNFCGYPFDKSHPQYKRKEDSLDRFTVNGMRRICEIFNLKKGAREDMVSVILGFLMKPTDSGKQVPTEVKKRKRTPKKDAKKTPNDKGKKSKEVVSEDDDDKEEEESPAKPAKKEKKEKPATPKKAKKSTESKSPTKKPKSAAKEKKPTKVKLPSKKASKSDKAVAKKKDVSDDEDDDEPLIKKAKSGSEPTDDDIKKRIHGILEGADLETITMKIVCKQVAESFPNHDLSPKKKFIKETVKEIIS